MKERKKRQPTAEEMMQRMAGLCAASEQCTFDIEKKLRRAELSEEEVRYILRRLHEERFIDDGRYAGAFARDKVRFSSWGRLKIRQALRAKRISDREISEALASIDDGDYAEAAERAGEAKARSLDLSEYNDRVKLMRHLLSRGFEIEVCRRSLSRIIKNNRDNRDNRE